MRHDYSALVTLALRYPTKQSMKMVLSTQRKPFICEREHFVQRIDIRTMSLTSVMELKKRPQHKVLAAIEESKYNPVDSRSGKTDWKKVQRLVVFMVCANLVVLLIAQQIAPDEMKKVIEEEESVVVGSLKFLSGIRSKEKESKENTKEETKDASKDYKSPLRDK